MTISQDADANLRSPSGVIGDYLRRSVSISDLVSRVWSGRLIVAAAALLGLLYGVYSVHATGPLYLATVQLSPAESDNNVGTLGSSGGASGLLAGLTGGAVTVPKMTQFLASIGSVGVAQSLDRKYDLLCEIYKGKCDPITHQWKKSTGVKEWFNGMLAELQGLPDPNGARTDSDLAAYLAAAVSIQTNRTTNLISLSYENRKPELAARYLMLVVKAANDYIRSQSHETQEKYVEYLSESAAKTANVEQRQAIDALLLQEERQLMMTEVDVPYAAKILDGPTVQPVSIALKTLAIDTFAGLVLGMLLTMLRDLMPGKWRIW